MRLVDADALYNGAMKEEYFDFKAHYEDGRESFAYSCAMQRLAEAPTIDAIPVEWLEQQFSDNPKSQWAEKCRDVYTKWQKWQRWQKEQEAR